jgi:prophage regulatory protein
MSTSIETERFIDLKSVKERTTLSRATIYDYIRKQSFPAPIQIGLRRVAWRESSVLAWMAAKLREAEKAVR